MGKVQAEGVAYLNHLSDIKKRNRDKQDDKHTREIIDMMIIMTSHSNGNTSNHSNTYNST